MKRAALSLAVVCALALPVAAKAQQSIDPGMTQQQVEQRFGKPSAARTSGTFTYLFFKNGCVRQCGIDDLVILDNGAVVDAVLRSAERTYSGRSTSPRAIPAEVAVRGGHAPRESAPEVIQAGAPQAVHTPDAAPASERAPAKPAAATPAEATPVEATPAPHADGPAITQPNRAPVPAARRDTTAGRLRIKVKPQHGSGASADSALMRKG